MMITLSAAAGLVSGRIAGRGRACRRSARPRMPFMSLALVFPDPCERLTPIVRRFFVR